MVDYACAVCQSLVAGGGLLCMCCVSIPCSRVLDYDVDWCKVQLDQQIVAMSPYGGPIGE